MKCPNCGTEVVIATDLCPWCGYKYSFDGEIPPKEPVYEPGEAPRRARRGRARGESSDAGERWTRAGVYNAEERGGSEEREGEKSSQPGMRWHNVVVNIIMPLTAAYYIYKGVNTLMSLDVMSTLSDFLWFYRYNTLLTVLLIASSAVYIISGVCVLAAAKQLKRFERRGVALYLAAIILPSCVNMVYRVVWMTYFEYYYGAFELTMALLLAVAYALLTAVYYSRRRGMFSGN